MIELKAGYRAFNGHVFTQSEADIYNHAYCKTEAEQHRLFTCIVYSDKKYDHLYTTKAA